jgi:multidrug efflux pump
VIYLAFERLRSRIVGRPTGTPAPETRAPELEGGL